VDLKLSEKIALVSGSTAGIGFAIAAMLAKEGASVVVNGRTSERVSAAVAAIQDIAPEAEVKGIAANLATSDGCNALIEQVPQVDILVNNLGVYEPKPFADITDEDWRSIIEANVMSGVRLSRHYMPQMMENNWGRIIFISSESAINIPAEMIHYGMTKAAQVAIARGLAETTAGTNVTVNSILAGPTRSEGVETFVQNLAISQGIDPQQVEKAFFEKTRPSSLIQRFATPDEVAAMVVYVASPLAAATNGAALRVEGGVVRSIL
jgi:NAD(P)-dependent dehydrogenase (short-subunit alcohol dehydrogenase family)